MSNLFVQEEEDFVMYEETEEDPVIQEIPVSLSTLAHSLYILQYPNRPKEKPLTRIAATRFKPGAGVIEMDIPLETGKFFDASKAEKWDNLEVQTLRGVLLDSDSTYYVGSVQDGELVLVPADKFAQLRPSLGHIDREVKDHKELTTAGKSHTAQVVQMSVKGVNEVNAPRLGGCLLAHKKFDDEPFVAVDWEDNMTCVVKPEQVLESGESRDEYLARIMQ